MTPQEFGKMLTDAKCRCRLIAPPRQAIRIDACCEDHERAFWAAKATFGDWLTQESDDGTSR